MLGQARSPVLLLAAVAALVGVVPPALAWGPDGHRLAGEIAWQRLDPGTRTEVREILGEGEYSTLAEASVWADQYAREFEQYRWAGPLHYVNVRPSADAYVRDRDCPRGRDCVVEAIHRFSGVVADRSRPRGERREALLFLVHFVEDIHQPLHVAHPDDRGGNNTLVYWFGRERNLHQVWDDELPRRFLDGQYGWSWLLGPAWKRHAEHLSAELAPEDWLAADAPEAWADESLALAKEHTYEVASTMELGTTYYEQTAPVAMRRIHQAGVRLAALLESLVGRR